MDLRGKQLRWLDHFIKGEANGAEKDPPIEIFVMGRNVWRPEKEWPPKRAQETKFYLHSGGAANTLVGDGTLSTEAPREEPLDRFDYDPAHPVPTTGGGTCCNPEILPWGPWDQRAVERRDDVVVYSTPPLEKELEVTGHVEVHLFAATSARDTDWTAKLVDVAPGGYARNLTDTILRARYRNSFQKAELLEPQKIYSYILDLGYTSYVFGPGHRIRLEVSSSNFPHYSRNTNTGNALETDREMIVAHQAIDHDSTFPSYFLLPVMPGE